MSKCSWIIIYSDVQDNSIGAFVLLIRGINRALICSALPNSLFSFRIPVIRICLANDSFVNL